MAHVTKSKPVLPLHSFHHFLSQAADKKVVELESTRDLSHTWMHVDMDAFYASVEELHDPTLANKPMAVGGMGMICTANYEVGFAI
jgi:hypothetical protein